MEKIKEEFNPLVSIIIPVYNGANYMREAIDSALAQTYKNIEIIVVNDGSTDNTEEIAKSYGDKIRYFKKENGGVATALNLAIEKSKGEYISWLSHDDVYYLDKIEKQISKLSELSELEISNYIVMSNYSLINEKSELIFNQQFHKLHNLNKLNYSLYPLLKGLVHGCTLLIPKKCFMNYGCFNSSLKTTQDYDLWFRMFPECKMIFMPNLLVKSRWHSEQGSKNITAANKEADDLWIKMVNNLTREQKIAIDDSELSFYQKTFKIVEGAEYLGAKNYLQKIIKNFKQRNIAEIKVSIIIPFYNRIEWTSQAIKSVVSQTHKNLEIIVVNDFSTDDIKSIEALGKNDKRIIIIKNKRQKGVSGARNTGIDFATGEYVAFLDSDDLFLPEKIEKQLEFMVKNGLVFSHTSYELFSDDNKFCKLINSGNTNLIFPSIIASCPIATPTVMIHSDIFTNKSIRFPEDFSIGEDTCLWVNISNLFSCRGMSVILTKVRRHKNNAAYDKEKQIEGLGNIIEFVIGNFFDEKIIEYINVLNRQIVKNGGHSKQVSINEYINIIYRSNNLQIGDNDLVGNKFNGHDLHFYLQDRDIDSRQFVWNKKSVDDSTFKIARNRPDREKNYKNTILLQKQYSLNGVLNPLGYDILCDPLFLNTNLVHLHLIHNNIFDIQLLPLMSRLKPIVWTVHDPWILGGHCIHHFDCEKWISQCGDCPYLEKHFALKKDNSALNFALKKDAIQNSKFDIIVASRWMEEKLRRSPILKGQNIHVIPFGINQNIFKPIDKNEARKKLEISEDALVISFRCDYSGFKGMDYIEYFLKNIKTDKKVTLLVLKDKLKKNLSNFNVKEFGWVKNDELLAQIYSASDLFLMPSAVESFGMMAIEVMSCGTLPIVLDGTALPSTVNAPECGVSVKKDKEEYLKTIQYFINHGDERMERAKKCIEFAKNNYNKDVYVGKIIKVYDKILKEHNISEEDQYLLNQLKKNVLTDTYLNFENFEDFKRQSFIENKINLARHHLQLLFLRYKNIFPKRVRLIIKKQLDKLIKN